MAAKAKEEAKVEAERAEHKFSKAQLRHFNELQGNVQRAQEELQKFVRYLGDEHELDNGREWVIGRNGFEEDPKRGNEGAPPEADASTSGPLGEGGEEVPATVVPEAA